MGLILGDLEKAGVEAFNNLSRKLDAIDEQAVKDIVAGAKEIIAEGRETVKKLNLAAGLLNTELAAVKTELAAVKAIRERLFHP